MPGRTGGQLTEAELIAVETLAEPMRPGNTEGPRDQGGAAGTSGRGEARTEAELV